MTKALPTEGKSIGADGEVSMPDAEKRVANRICLTPIQRAHQAVLEVFRSGSLHMTPILACNVAIGSGTFSLPLLIFFMRFAHDKRDDGIQAIVSPAYKKTSLFKRVIIFNKNLNALKQGKSAF